MTICSSYGIKTQEIKGKLFITYLSCTTKWVTRKHSDSFYIHMKPAFYFEIPRDTNRYLILGILDEAGYPHCCLLGQPKQVFNPQLN